MDQLYFDNDRIQKTISPVFDGPLEDKILSVARVAYAAYRQFAEIQENPQPDFEHLPPSRIASLCNGVVNVLYHPEITPEENHTNWLALKVSGGWKHKPEGNPDYEKKLHPCVAPWHKLSDIQRKKDVLFLNVIKTFLVDL